MGQFPSVRLNERTSRPKAQAPLPPSPKVCPIATSRHTIPYLPNLVSHPNHFILPSAPPPFSPGPCFNLLRKTLNIKAVQGYRVYLSFFLSLFFPFFHSFCFFVSLCSRCFSFYRYFVRYFVVDPVVVVLFRCVLASL